MPTINIRINFCEEFEKEPSCNLGPTCHAAPVPVPVPVHPVAPLCIRVEVTMPPYTKQHTAALASPRREAPETVFEETFVPLEHGEMLHLSDPRRVSTSTRSFEALLTPGRGRLRPMGLDSVDHTLPHSRAVSDTSTVLPAPFRAGRRTVSTPGEMIDAACVELARSGTFTCQTSQLLSSMAAEEGAAS